jgi:N,N'-diacetylchitobiose transport system permease protein
LIVIGALLGWPIIKVVLLSFQNYGLRQIVSGTWNFNGGANYADVLGSAQLWQVVLPNTVVFAILAVTATVVLGTLVALLLAKLGPILRGIVSSVIMIAWAMPAVTGTYVWSWIFDADAGIANQLLMSMGWMDQPFNWFTNRFTFYAIVLLNVVHHGFPFVAITVLAAFLGVPREHIEAAEMDGAGPWRVFWLIVIPQLRQVFAIVIILSTIWDFKVFTQVYLMPGGDGANRDVLNLGVWSYTESFGQNKFGYGSTIAVLLTVVLLIVTVIYARTILSQEDGS